MLGIISKLYKIQGTNTIKAITIGNNIVQQNDINWSKRILGKEALTHIKTKIKIQDLIPKTIPLNIPSIKGSDKNNSLLVPLSVKDSHASKSIYWIKLIKGIKLNIYPPRNKILVNIQISTILAYSAKKKNTNITAACSVIKPLTNSDSASAKSKGALLVSATEPIKKIMNMGNKGIINQIALWASIFTDKFKLPVNNTTNKMAELKINS